MQIKMLTPLSENTRQIPRYTNGQPTDLQVIGLAFERIGVKPYIVAGENSIYLQVGESVKLRFSIKGEYLKRQ